jgi:hypothetical protein
MRGRGIESVQTQLFILRMKDQVKSFEGQKTTFGGQGVL